MRRAILCRNMDEFNEIERRINEAMVVDGAIQDCWAEPEIMLVIESSMIKHLTEDERGRIVALFTEGEEEEINEDRVRVATLLEELEGRKI